VSTLDFALSIYLLGVSKVSDRRACSVAPPKHGRRAFGRWYAVPPHARIQHNRLDHGHWFRSPPE
jgi:hypothetical protein